MTPVQWSFQYYAIQTKRKAELESKIILNDLLAQDIETLSMVINPKVAKEYIKLRNEQRKKFKLKLLGPDTDKVEDNRGNDDININTLDINDEHAVQKVMEKYYDTAPSTITVPAHVVNSNKFVLPKFNRNKMLQKNKRRFIQIDSNNIGSNEVIDNETNSTDLLNIKITPKKSKRERIKIDLKEEGDK